MEEKNMLVLANKEKFISLLLKAKRDGMGKLIEWLEKSDFFTAPASTRYHSNYEGGLVEHSLYVYELFKKKNEQYDLGLSEDTVIIASLLHDLCKANFYIESTRNVKKDGKWVQVPYYTVDDQLPLGHGDKSVIMLQNFIKLSKDEMLMIRWHMGGYEAPTNYNTMSAAWGICKAAVCLHTSDLEASYLFERHEEA